jgi:TolA-binding protein
MGRYLILAMLAAATLGTAAVSQADNVEQRLERIERLLRSEVLLDMDRAQRQLQSEFAALRNDLDLLARQVRELQQQQRSVYQELDDRVEGTGALLGPGTGAVGPVDDLPVDDPLTDDLSVAGIGEATGAEDAAREADEVAFAPGSAPDTWTAGTLDAEPLDPLQALIDERTRLLDARTGAAGGHAGTGNAAGRTAQQLGRRQRTARRTTPSPHRQ